MLYRRNHEPILDKKLFQNPTSEYRGVPFWAWNAALNTEELKEQIDCFCNMGFGGFHMHVRQGLETEYMSPEFMDAVKACSAYAEQKGMYAWLYDEDRWPSGCAGGRVTVDVRYRKKYLLMSKERQAEETADSEEAYITGKPLFLGAFRIKINAQGILTEYQKALDTVSGEDIRYFYCMTEMRCEPRYNGQTYVDCMSKEAIDRFILLTHEKYKDELEEWFGNTIPAIFTDEPQLQGAIRLNSGFSKKDAVLPFSIDFPETFLEKNGYDLRERLPELFFACADKKAMKTRYDYCRHSSFRFHAAYDDHIGKWCQENKLMLTGHALGEDTLEEMADQGYEVMRFYKEMEFPGIDMLCDDRAFTTPIQCRSVVRQYGKEGMLSELYGVTGWDFDFRDHKFQGDWQACLGVTVRVPHLAWQTMKGEGKRDYPASIFYQSPWYLEYKQLEDHYARVATAMTRGKACVRIGVLHPLEGYWMEKASHAETLETCKEYEEHFHTLAEWMLRNQIEFDYLSQSLLPEQSVECGTVLKVGHAKYDVLLLCDCITLREEVLTMLEKYVQAGGRLLVMGKKPAFCDGAESARVAVLAEHAIYLPYSKTALLSAMEEYRDIEICNEEGIHVDKLMCAMREDCDRKWLFAARIDKPQLKHVVEEEKLVFKVKGSFEPWEYDTLSGEIKRLPYRIIKKWEPLQAEMEKTETWIYKTLYNSDSLLAALVPLENTSVGSTTTVEAEEEITVERTAEGIAVEKAAENVVAVKIAESEREVEIKVPYLADYTLSEPNVLVLDMAEYRVNGGPWVEKEEIMRIDEQVRRQLGLPTRKTKVVQPYVIRQVPQPHTLELRYTIMSQGSFEAVSLALENAEACEIYFNGTHVIKKLSGYYVDKYIKKVPLGKLVEGVNEIVLKMPFGQRTDLEACYLLGNFGTSYHGREQYIYPLPEKLYFGSVVHQGLAFYGGNIRYQTEIELDEVCDLEIELTHYRGALVKVTLDEKETKILIYAPYKVVFEKAALGKHTIVYELLGNRYNTFSALHTLLADKKRVYMGPDYWRSSGDGWAYEYQTRSFGILKTPIVRKRMVEKNS